MKRYKRYESIEVKDYKEKIIGLKGSNYPLHLKDLEEGYIPLEMEMLPELFEINNLDINKLNEEQYFKSLEYIFEKIQDIIELNLSIKG
jgi:hypothetical protein